MFLLRLLLLLLPVQAVPARADEPSPRLGLPTAIVGAIPVGDQAPTPRFSRDGRWMVIPRGRRLDPDVGGWSRTSFVLVDLRDGTLVLRVGDLSCGPHGPVFDRRSRWLAWGERVDATTLRVHARALADGATTAFEVRHRVGRGYTVLCAIAENGRRVAVAEPDAQARRHALLVLEAKGETPLARRGRFAEPALGSRRYCIEFVGKLVVHHTRAPHLGGAGHYRLEVFDTESKSLRADLGAWIARETCRFVVTPDGKRLVNGDSRYDITVTELPTGETRTLANLRKDLYSHWLELTASPDGRRVAVWSDERKRVVVLDIEDGARHDVDHEERLRVLGFDPTGRRLCTVSSPGALQIREIEDGAVLAERTTPKHRTHLDPTGHVLVTAEETDGVWHLLVERIDWKRLD